MADVPSQNDETETKKIEKIEWKKSRNAAEEYGSTIKLLEKEEKKMLNIGITTRSFNGLSVKETAEQMQKVGFKCTELCFVHSDLGGWAYNGIGDLTGITPARVCEAAEEFRSRGIEVTSLGMFTDLRNPDDEVMAREKEYILRYIDMAAEAGIPYLASECGFTPGQRGINADRYESDYARIKETLRFTCLEAEARGVHMALEACVLDVIPSPRRLKTLIEELEAESGVRLGAMLDPANFIAAEDEEGMFRHLKHDVYYFHGKDRKINATYGVNLGDGDIDWPRFMELYMRFTDKVPFILEYANKDNCAEIKARAESAYETALQNILGRLN